MASVVSIVTALLYGLSPIDLIPDLLPLLGWVDDAVLIPLLLAFAVVSWRKHNRGTDKTAP